MSIGATRSFRTLGSAATSQQCQANECKGGGGSLWNSVDPIKSRGQAKFIKGCCGADAAYVSGRFLKWLHPSC